MNPENSELQLLQTISSAEPDGSAAGTGLSQRDLARRSGLSLGMTNALLRRFIERGWVKFRNASGKNLGYALTPEGAEVIVLRSLRYFTRAARSASLYRDKIDAFVRKTAFDGFTSLVLEGPAELDFLFDYACQRHGLLFIKNPRSGRRENLALDSLAMFVLADFTLDDDTIRPVGSSSVMLPIPASSTSLSSIILHDVTSV